MSTPRTSPKIKPVTRWMVATVINGQLELGETATRSEGFANTLAAALRGLGKHRAVRVRITPIEPKPKKRSAKR